MSKKDYKQGISDAMAAYEAFGEKQEAAIRHVGAEIERTAGKVDQLGGKIGEITDYITDKEKAALYKLNTPVDIADLDDAEKRILLAVLYQLSADEDEVTAEQQNYVRAVQQYLKIYNPQTEIDLSAVENIEDISAQKAVLQSVLEFFRLGAHPEELTEEQEDFLDYFQVNRRTRREIDGFITAIVEAVGIKGLSEKYGFVAEQPRSEFAKYQDNGRIPEKVADICIAQLKGKDEDDYDNDDEEYGVSLVKWFMDWTQFLETKDYIVFFKARYDGIDHDEQDYEDYDLNADKNSGLFRVHKQSGKVERIHIDYGKIASLPFYGWSNNKLVYYIVQNMIYLTISEPTEEEKVWVLAVDVSEQASRVLTFPHTSNGFEYIHMSANESYLMIAILEAYGCDEMRPVKSYVVDLTQNDRIFVLDSGLYEVYDAFLWEGKFLFWGIKKKGTPDSLYCYDPGQKTLENILPEMDSKKFRGLRASFSGPFDWRLNSLDYLTTIDHMWRVDDRYHYWLTNRTYYGSEHPLSLIRLLPDGYLCTWTNVISCHCLKKVSYQEEDFELEGSYILLGDYLYRSNSEGWQKTNISNGLDNLQWEIFQMPD